MINLDKYNVIDISMKLGNGLLSWPGKRHTFKHYYPMNMRDHDHANVSRIETSMHTGTHVDAPYHKINEAKKLHQLSINNFMGKAQVLDLTHVKKLICLDDVKNKIESSVEIILLKTTNSELLQTNEFSTEYVCLDFKAAEYLSTMNIKAICVDYLSIDKYNSQEPINHKIFLTNNILIYEAVDLLGVKSGLYFFIGLPINLDNAEGALVRALLLEENQ